MLVMKNVAKMTVLAMVGALFFPEYAYGYIDPGTGSYVFQIIVAAFVAGSFMVKIYWHKIKNFIGRLFSKKEQ